MPRIRTFYSFDDECIYLRWVEATRPESRALSFGVFRDGQLAGYQGPGGRRLLDAANGGLGRLRRRRLPWPIFLSRLATARAVIGKPERMLVEADP
jgi:hypothetical protein